MLPDLIGILLINPRFMMCMFQFPRLGLVIILCQSRASDSGGGSGIGGGGGGMSRLATILHLLHDFLLN